MVQAGSLRQVQIYAQGKRLVWPPEAGNRIQLFVPQ
jgi:hypothetical protein